MTLNQFADFLAHYNGALIAALFLFLALMTNRARVWVWSSDVAKYAEEIKQLQEDVHDLERDKARLTIERDEARFHAILGTRAVERFAELQKGAAP